MSELASPPKWASDELRQKWINAWLALVPSGFGPQGGPSGPTPGICDCCGAGSDPSYDANYKPAGTKNIYKQIGDVSQVLFDEHFNALLIQDKEVKEYQLFWREE